MNAIEAPLLVGTACGLEALVEVAGKPEILRMLDIVEARLDAMAETALDRCIDACRDIEAAGTATLATIRIAAEGGGWRGTEAARRALFDRAISACAWIDVEAASPIAPEVAAAAHSAGRRAVVSHHDFGGTPALETMIDVVEKAFSLGADVAKVATTVTSLDDHDTLLALLRKYRDGRDLCISVIGMGPLGLSLRVYLPAVGSAFAYSYLDRPAAPGQLSCAQMFDLLRLQVPAFDRRRDHLPTRRSGGPRSPGAPRS